MNVFVDTSGLFALMVSNDYMHVRAKKIFKNFMQHDIYLVSSSFVLVETTTLLQRRVGMESIFDFQDKLAPLLDIIWVDEEWYEKAIYRLMALRQSKVSLVDCLSFVIMEAKEITQAFSFDKHFVSNGFSLAE